MKYILYILSCIIGSVVTAQDISYGQPGKTFYNELPDPGATKIEEWQLLKSEVNVSFGSDNIRYPKKSIPFQEIRTNWDATAWKGEKVHTQILVWSKKYIPKLRLQLRNLINEKGTHISYKNIKAGFVKYVMSDEFDGGCAHNKKVYDSSLVEDPIDIIDSIPVQANTVQPIWLSIQVPASVPAGRYYGTITINAIKRYQLRISLNVLNHILPPVSQWKYDLDLWQYPYPIAKMHNVKLWSKEHFNLMRPYYTALANAGQKTITADIIEQPWGLDHIYFKDPTLIKWIKKKDGSWVYDFSLFDKYISFVMSCGIKKRINCYTMITWDLSFIYFDERVGKNATIKIDPATPEFSIFWTPMLKQFTAHLKSKGWFDITSIAMDERPLESMKAVIVLLKSIDPAWKISLAANNYYPEIQKDIFDLSIASYLDIDQNVLNERKVAHKPTTFYTACIENHPGPYTFSPPAENTWLGWHAAFKGYTGYLFWAFNAWPPKPLIDARYSHYPSGTFFQFYPGPRTSIRFEKLIEGIQDFEKISILKEQFAKEGKIEGIKELDAVLSSFEIKNLDSIPAAEMVEKAKATLNKF